jgi:hypothetical protein
MVRTLLAEYTGGERSPLMVLESRRGWEAGAIPDHAAAGRRFTGGESRAWGCGDHQSKRDGRASMPGTSSPYQLGPAGSMPGGSVGTAPTPPMAILVIIPRQKVILGSFPRPSTLNCGPSKTAGRRSNRRPVRGSMPRQSCERCCDPGLSAYSPHDRNHRRPSRHPSPASPKDNSWTSWRSWAPFSNMTDWTVLHRRQWHLWHLWHRRPADENTGETPGPRLVKTPARRPGHSW